MKKKSYTIHKLLLLLFLSSMFIFSCDGLTSITEAEEYQELDTFPLSIKTEISVNLYGQLIEDNKLVMEYRSPLVYQRTDTPFIEFVGGVRANMFNAKTGEPSGYLESEYGIYKRKQKMMYFRDKVRVVNKNGDVLRADDLWWDQEEKHIRTDKRISFLQSGSKIYGVGLDALDDMSEYEIRQLTGKIEGGSF